MFELSKEEKKKFKRYIIQNFNGKIVPNDEGNEDALLYNLIHFIEEGKDFEPYNYLPQQDEEISSFITVEIE